MFGEFKLFGGSKKEQHNNPLSAIENDSRIGGLEFKNRADAINENVNKLAEEYEQLRKLPSVGNENLNEIEDLRALKIEDLKNKIISEMGEVNMLQRAAEGQTMSVFANRVEELESNRKKLHNLLTNSEGIIVSKGYDRKAA